MTVLSPPLCDTEFSTETSVAYLPILFPDQDTLDFSALKALRVLRPLRTVNKIRDLRNIMTALFAAIPLLKDAIVILLFFFMIFAIAGL